MNVEISIEKSGTLTFDMTEEQVSVMLAAVFGSNARTNAHTDAVTHNVALETQNEALNCNHKEVSKIPYKKPEVLSQSKVERMFGNDWRKNDNRTSPQPSRYVANEEGYKGFLLLECPQCGKRKAFCTKNPIKSSYCSCGFEIELSELKVARLDCKCGKTWKYRTNIKAQNFTHSCLDCSSPIDVIFNPRHGNYETLR